MGWSGRPKHGQRSCETSAGPPPLFLLALGGAAAGLCRRLEALSGPGGSDPGLGTARRPGYPVPVPVPVPVPQSLAPRIHSPNILFQLRTLPYALSNRPEDPPKAPVNSP